MEPINTTAHSRHLKQTSIIIKLQWIFLLILLSAQMDLQAQKLNPFQVKTKVHKSNILFNLSGQLPKLPVKDKQGTMPPKVTYYSIPFVQGINTERQSLHHSLYNKGKLVFLESAQQEKITFSPQDKKSIKDAALHYLSTIKEQMKIRKPEEEFRPIASHTDDFGLTHIKLQQYYNGIKVYGGQVVVHGKNGKMNKFNGEYFPTPETKNTQPTITSQQAFEIVRDHLNIAFMKATKEDTVFLHYKPVVSELVFYHSRDLMGPAKLTWHLTVRPNLLMRYEYFVDAYSGKILNFYNNTCSDGPAATQNNDLNGVSRTIHTYLVNGNYFLIDASRTMFNQAESNLPDNGVGTIWTIDAKNTSASQDLKVYQFASSSNSWSDHPEAVSAHYNAGEVYEYYLHTHGRNSINGKGGTIISICNIANKDGSSMANAFWNGRAMFYGNGGSLFKPLSGALDVGAHEMGHGVIQNTCNLEYQDESGALNESMADISGTMVDRGNWFLGETIVKNTQVYPTGHLRDMSNPHNGGASLNDACFQPANVNEKYTGNQDNGGVHINSGIMNFAYFKFATAIGKDKAEKIWYKSMTDYLVKLSQFADARVAFVQAATDIFGANSTETQAVKQAFTDVGIVENSDANNGNGPGQDDLQPNSGQDYILSVNPDTFSDDGLYITTTDGSSGKVISSSKLLHKPSVTDDGSVAVFVNTDYQLKYIDMTNSKEDFLSRDSVFENVAISKDGKRLAVVSIGVDSAIWVYDFGVQEWAKYHLFNPTFSTGEVTNNVIYADALEWDYTGQYIIYDAYNQLKNAGGEDVDYWDMGIIRVWSNKANTWGDGKIEKVFSNLPEGVSIGNPSLSKNSPYIISFDYYDANKNAAAVMAANMATGENAVIFNNTVLGYPNYSKNDDKIIFDAQDNSGQPIVAQIGIKTNKIEPNGEASILLNNKQWGVWFAMGSRVIDAVKQYSVSTFTLYPNPAYQTLNLLLSVKSNGKNHVVVYNLMGQVVIDKIFPSSQMLFHLNVSSLPKGTYFIRLLNGQNSLSKKFCKM